MRFIKIIAGTFFFLSSLTLAHAQNANVELEISANKKTIKVGEQFTITLTLKQINVSNRLSLPRITIPGTEKFQHSGQRTSQNVQLINGQMIAIVEQTHVFTASTEGEYKIGPLKFVLAGPTGQQSKPLESNSIQITVKNEVAIAEAGEAGEGETNTIEKIDRDLELFFTPLTIKGLKIAAGIFLIMGGIFLYFLSRKPKIKESPPTSPGNESQKHNDPEKTIQYDYKPPEAEPVSFTLVNGEMPSVEAKDFYEKVYEVVGKFLNHKEGLDINALRKREILRKIKEKPYAGEIKFLLDSVETHKYAQVESDREKIRSNLERLFQYSKS